MDQHVNSGVTNRGTGEVHLVFINMLAPLLAPSSKTVGQYVHNSFMNLNIKQDKASFNGLGVQ